MTFKSEKQPLCRYCGGPVPKWTSVIFFGASEPRFGRTEKPRSKEEAQRLVNGKVVSLRYHEDSRERYVRTITTWDGQSYADQFFCHGDHAKQFGYVMAEAGHQTKAHATARTKALDAEGWWTARTPEQTEDEHVLQG